MRGARVAAFPLLLAIGEPAAAQEFDPASVDLPALIECRAGVEDYNGFAFWLAGDPTAASQLGWNEAATDNPFLKEYSLPQPVIVFGREASSVVFTATGPMAVLDGAVSRDVAKELGIVPMVDSGEKFLGEKVVLEESEQSGESTFVTRVSLNVSTVESHPGRTLAGCSYSIEVK